MFCKCWQIAAFQILVACMSYCHSFPKTTDDRGLCNLPPETGPCRAAFQQWFYNASAHDCEIFIYGGCNGNNNRFKDRESCMKTCFPTQKHNTILDDETKMPLQEMDIEPKYLRVKRDDNGNVNSDGEPDKISQELNTHDSKDLQAKNNKPEIESSTSPSTAASTTQVTTEMKPKIEEGKNAPPGKKTKEQTDSGNAASAAQGKELKKQLATSTSSTTSTVKKSTKVDTTASQSTESSTSPSVTGSITQRKETKASSPSPTSIVKDSTKVDAGQSTELLTSTLTTTPETKSEIISEGKNAPQGEETKEQKTDSGNVEQHPASKTESKRLGKSEEQTSHFAGFFLASIVAVFVVYGVYHNRQKIIAIVIEGRNMNGRGRRGGYNRLETTVEEAMPSMKSTNTAYVY